MDGRPESSEFGAFYAGYVARVPDGDIVERLRGQLVDTLALLTGPGAGARAGHRYAPGKWSVREVLGHLADAERVFAARALRFARGDGTPLPGFDENAYVPAGRFDERPLPELVAELSAVRGSTVALFAGLPAEAWPRRGTANGSPITVRALAWVIAGHELHHVALLRERYGLGGGGSAGGAGAAGAPAASAGRTP